MTGVRYFLFIFPSMLHQWKKKAREPREQAEVVQLKQKANVFFFRSSVCQQNIAWDVIKFGGWLWKRFLKKNRGRWACVSVTSWVSPCLVIGPWSFTVKCNHCCAVHKCWQQHVRAHRVLLTIIQGKWYLLFKHHLMMSLAHLHMNKIAQPWRINRGRALSYRCRLISPTGSLSTSVPTGSPAHWKHCDQTYLD